MLIGTNPDLQKANIAFEIDELDGVREERVVPKLITPRCVPVLTQNPRDQAHALPKYLVRSAELLHVMKRDNLRIKIIGFGEGSPSCIRSLGRGLSSCSIQYQQATR